MKKPPQADRLGTQISPNQRPSPRGRVAFIKNEVDHRQHGIQPGGKFGRFRYRIRDACVADLSLRSNQPLRHGRTRHQECPRDFIRIETA